MSVLTRIDGILSSSISRFRRHSSMRNETGPRCHNSRHCRAKNVFFTQRMDVVTKRFQHGKDVLTASERPSMFPPHAATDIRQVQQTSASLQCTINSSPRTTSTTRSSVRAASSDCRRPHGCTRRSCWWLMLGLVSAGMRNSPFSYSVDRSPRKQWNPSPPWDPLLPGILFFGPDPVAPVVAPCGSP